MQPARIEIVHRIVEDCQNTAGTFKLGIGQGRIIPGVSVFAIQIFVDGKHAAAVGGLDKGLPSGACHNTGSDRKPVFDGMTDQGMFEANFPGRNANFVFAQKIGLGAPVFKRFDAEAPAIITAKNFIYGGHGSNIVEAFNDFGDLLILLHTHAPLFRS